jgi:hypothetical protein
MSEDTIRVRVSQGCYNLVRPHEESIEVTVIIPGLETVHFGLPVDEAEHLRDDRLWWGDLVREADRIYRKRTWMDSRRADKDALMKWVAEPTETNLNRLDQAYGEQRLESLNKSIARLTEERDKVAKSLSYCTEFLATPVEAAP